MMRALHTIENGPSSGVADAESDCPDRRATLAKTLVRAGLVLAALSPGMAAAQTEGQALEQEVIDYRREHLRHGSVELVVRQQIAPPRPQSAWDNGRWVFEFREGGYIRRDFTSATAAAMPTLTTIVTPEETIKETTDEIGIIDTPYVTQGYRAQVFHPDVLGSTMGSFELVLNFTLEERLGHPDRLEETVVDEELAGTPVKHVAYERAAGAHVDLWIAPAQGFAVLKARAASANNPSVEMTSKYRQFPPGVWYPEQVENVKRETDGRVRSHDIVTVETADFSKEPDETRFSLLSMDVPIGTVIKDTGVEKVWNGRTLETRDEARQREVREVERSVTPTNPYFVWAILFGLAAIAMGIYRIRGK